MYSKNGESLFMGGGVFDTSAFDASERKFSV